MHQTPHKALLTALLIGASMSATPALAAGETKQETSKEPRAQVGEIIDDAWITTKVKTLLLKEDALSALKIDVDTKDGMVRLSGEVGKPEQVARAMEVASKVAGVKSVQADLTLKK